MARYVWVIVLYALTAGVYWQNSRGTGTVVVFPWIEALVGNDRTAMAQATVWMLGGVATGMLLMTMVSGRRSSDPDA